MWGFGGPGSGPGFVGCGGFGPVGMIFMFVFWALIIGLIAWGLMRMSRRGMMMHGMHGMHMMGGDNALNIARERYAKGEIDEQEFEEIKKNLS
jgi:putative membrane protein